MTDSPLRRLPDFGQSPWLDFIQRGLIESGELARLIERWGLRGITSNPTIFEQAIAKTGDYAAEIARLAMLGRTALEIYEALALADVSAAADLFLPLYRDSNGADGFSMSRLGNPRNRSQAWRQKPDRARCLWLRRSQKACGARDRQQV